MAEGLECGGAGLADWRCDVAIKFRVGIVSFV